MMGLTDGVNSKGGHAVSDGSYNCEFSIHSQTWNKGSSKRGADNESLRHSTVLSLTDVMPFGQARDIANEAGWFD